MRKWSQEVEEALQMEVGVLNEPWYLFFRTAEKSAVPICLSATTKDQLPWQFCKDYFIFLSTFFFFLLLWLSSAHWSQDVIRKQIKKTLLTVKTSEADSPMKGTYSISSDCLYKGQHIPFCLQHHLCLKTMFNAHHILNKDLSLDNAMFWIFCFQM